MRRIIPFLKDAWRFAWPYYSPLSEERWSARGLLAAYVLMRLFAVGLDVVYNYWNRAWFTSLQDKNWSVFINLLLFGKHVGGIWLPGFALYAGVAIAMAVLRLYTVQYLQLRWRRWMTERLLGSWLGPDRAHYRLSLKQGSEGSAYTDNPDQRIAEDVRDFVGDAVTNRFPGTMVITVDFFSNVVELGSFLLILWSLSGPFNLIGFAIPGFLVWVALIYAVLGTWLTHLVGRKLAPLNFKEQKVEADFRFALVRARENSEGIALYGGEEMERDVLRSRFGALAKNWRQLMTRYKYLTGLTATYGTVAGVLPFIIAAPPYFAGLVPLGALTQTADAFSNVQNSLSWFVNNYQNLAIWRAIVVRLTRFQEAIEIARAHAFDGVHEEAETGSTYALHGATVKLPDGQELLSRENLKLQPGAPILITGRSGAGKSTLFRAFAGIWPFGSGGVQRARGRTLFLPQRTYIPLGTLRNAVCYPDAVSSHGDADVRVALTDAGLTHLLPRLDDEDNWSLRLSGGEQQRLAMARALLIKPDWLFLDEATANLDPEGEQSLYEVMHRKLPDTTIVSIAHRPSLKAFHTRHVILERTQGSPGRIIEVEKQAAD
jgi:putative ATP-binding cassette transporter